MAPDQTCRGPVPFGSIGRRAFLQTGLAGIATLSLPAILRLQSQGRANPATPTSARPEKKAVIMVWQPGGPSHLDSYDPKPNSGSEYRGPFNLISTRVPGMHFTELMPRQAAIADKMVVLRSMRQSAGGHPAGSMQLLSGDPDTREYIKTGAAEKVTLDRIAKPAYEPGEGAYHYVLARVDGDRISLEVIGVDWGRNYQPYRSNKADLSDK